VKKIVIDDVIGWWPNTASNIRWKLEGMGGEPVTVEINSPGGSVIEGIAIFNLLRDYAGEVTVEIIGMAASMASYIALAGDTVKAWDNAIFMIHNVWSVISGDHNEMRKQADIQESLTELIAKKYAEKTGKNVEEMRKAMDEESWYFGSEILEAGFADEIVESGTGTDRAVSVTHAKGVVEAMASKTRGESINALAAELKHCGALGCDLKNRTMKESENSPKPTQGDEVEKFDWKSVTADTLAQNAPDLLAQIRAEAVKDERERIAAIAKVDPLGLKAEKFEELKAKALEDGMDVPGLVMAVHEALAAQRAEEQEKIRAEAEKRQQDGKNLAGLMREIQPGNGQESGEDKEAKEKALALKLADEMTGGK